MAEKVSNVPNMKPDDVYLNHVLREALLNNNVTYLYTQKNNKMFFLESLTHFISEKSFELAKQLWFHVKMTFFQSESYKPFIFFDRKKGEFNFCRGNKDEELAFGFNDENELFYQGNMIVLNPLSLQKLFFMYKDDGENVDGYAHYYISRELEKFQEQKIQTVLV